MSPSTLPEAARAARVALPLALAVGALMAASPLGCADSDGVPVTESGGTQTTPPITKKGDSLPGGAISFFNSPTCPEGWATFQEGAGRVLVPTTGADKPLVTKGAPLKDGEDRLHGHDASAELTLSNVSYVGVAGGGNNGVAGAQTITLSTPVEKASSGIPYVQLLVCKKLGEPLPGAAAVPRGLMIYFNGAACPDGYTQPMATQGRMLVGLPKSATAGITFGGSALKSGEDRAHAHAVNGKLTTTPHGIALGSGCCGDGYAKDGEYAFVGASTDDRVDLPTIQVLQCQKD